MRVREPVDFGELRRRLGGRCFICELLAGDADYAHEVHWHLAPLPPGVPFEQQQLRALDRDDCLDVPPEEMAALANRVRAAVGR